MSQLVYVISYLSVIVFIAAVVYRFADYVKKPMHIRWELYPVAHENKPYGGSYLEDVDWWKKPRHVSRAAELKVMIPEIVFLKAVWENNRPLWYLTFPFHMGLYLIVVFIGLQIVGAVLALAGAGMGALSGLITVLTKIVGPIGFILCLFGSVTLFFKRLNDAGMRNYSSAEHFFNLALFAATMVVSLIAWRAADPDFYMVRGYLANLISFKLTSLPSAVVLLQVLMASLVIAYIPLTHMSHFFMKYFLYHDIRWGDEPNVNNPATQAKIGVVLNYPVTWAASHIAGHGRSTWAEVATFNPAAKPEKEEK